MADWRWRWGAILAVNLAGWCMLGLNGVSRAAPEDKPQPFRNSVEQRQEMISHLREIQSLLETQNELLRKHLKKQDTPRGSATR